MELASLVRRIARGVFSNRRLLQLATLAIMAAWALPLLAQDTGVGDAAVGGNTKTDQVAPPEADAETFSWEGAQKVAIIIAILVLPVVIGNFLARKLRMPEHGWKFALAIGSLAAAGVIVAMGEIKLGPDLSGGITLIYEVQDRDAGQAPAVAGDQDEADAADGEDAGAAADEADSEGAADADGDQDAGGDPNAYAGDDNMGKLIRALIERVDPAGTKEVSIKQFGEGQIEIIIPKAEKSELEAIERRIYTSGVLEFRITASPRFSKHQSYIKAAEALPPGQNIVRLGGREVARWVGYDERQFGDADQAERSGLVVRMSGETPQVLVMTDDGLNVTGDFLRSAASDVDQFGGPAVSFVFDQLGAFKFKQLTTNHQPNPSGEKYNLGILLDNRLLSAPTLNDVISDRGIISGLENEAEVEFLVGILNAGSLPASLNKVPISRAQISPTLGQLTVEQGKRALIISLALVAVFMVFYYKKAGFISWLGLAANMLLILGCMVLIKAAFTLPGLAGLVLTVGMSVDANVLIYERIREELKRGAALRMAIRNGFNRASITILDSNVTNLITAAVIYKIAPDSVKGFGVTLFLGILMSVYTAVFLTRIVFDVAERRGWLRNMSMREFVGETRFDFLGWSRVWITASLLVIGVGLAAVYMRGRDLLDIDFTGGSSVTIVLKEDQAMEFADVDAALRATPLGEANLSLVAVGDTKTRYTVTTINDDVEKVEEILTEAFDNKLETYQVRVEDIEPIPPAGESVGAVDIMRSWNGWLVLPLPTSYVTLLQEQPTEGATTPESEPAAPPTGEAESTAADTETTPADAPAEVEPASSADTTATEPPAVDSTTTDAPASTNEPPAAADAPAGETAPASAAGASGDGADIYAGGTSARINFSIGSESGETAGVSHDTLAQLLRDTLDQAGHAEVAFALSNPGYQEGSSSMRTFKEWDVKLALPETDARQVFDTLTATTNEQAMFPLSNKIGGRVAGRMASDAIAAIVLCLIGIIGYVWFRFHGVIYGIAAVIALIHDVLVTLGFVAISSYFVDAVPPLASALMIDKFQINLVLVAAFLTIIGYSLNDTIVIFDRIREVKGKSPRLTRDMINLAVNQTLARTILTSFTTLMSTIVLYIFGGDGIHAFAFALLVGFVAGCYSTIFIANPVLFWLAQRFEGTAASPTAKAA
jgi:SecD/SecF fusion protein